ncbi:hypothetical protein QFZ64_004235 [Streptomyces sp. B3I8]|nr:hypothetical protein [Streptomyces sp. B3I8]
MRHGDVRVVGELQFAGDGPGGVPYLLLQPGARLGALHHLDEHHR